jgi:hypothetical protein
MSSKPEVERDSFPFQKDLYDKAVRQDIQLSLIQDVDPENAPPGYTPVELSSNAMGPEDPKGESEPIWVVQVEAGEGDVGVFTILHASFEDVKGAYLLMTDIQKKFKLLSPQTYNAMVMVDPWNPVYSWRRGVLLQYVPDEATFNPDTKSFDMEQRFIDAVKASPRMQDETSPEYEFVQNLSKTSTEFQDTLTEYFKKVQKRLKSQDGIADYLKLAESRRRVYRPVPMDEFSLTLPWAWLWKYTRPLEMTPDGTIQEINDRGYKFLETWIGSLRTFDPLILPRADANDGDDTAVLAYLLSIASTPKPTPNLAVSYKTSRANSSSESGCPFRSRAPRVSKLKGISVSSSLRTRKDIRNLTRKEVQTYQAKLQDFLEDESLNSKWQALTGLRW